MRRSLGVLAATSLALAVLAPVGSEADATADLVVHTVSGDVRGLVTGPAVEWRAIPYAAPPVGPLRWRPPRPAEPWTGVRASTEFAPECIQLGDSDTTTDGSEDCLYLNVFAPADAARSAGLPVMVHLHGGSNFFFHPYQHADAFVRRGVVMVTLGYRLGVMGFAGHPALTEEGSGSSGEYGVLDQLAALHWVQDNIAAFGGDPGNVTLMGESAGSFDAVAIAASPLGEGLFRRLAAQTEAFWALQGEGTIRDAEAIGSRVSEAVGCASGSDALACLRSRPADQLVVAAGPNDVSPWVGGHVLPASPLQLIRDDATPLPMLLGSNREEASLYFAPWELPPGDDYTANDRARDTNWLVGPQRGKQLRTVYPVRAYDSSFWASIAAFSDGIYTCPIRRLALANRAPVHRYLYTHVYDTVPDPVIVAARARHFWDEPLLWHDTSLLFGIDFAFSPEEEALSARMTDYWTNFAKTGDPNGPGVEPWAPYTATSPSIKVLDEPSSDLTGYHDAQCDYFDRVPHLQAPAQVYAPLRWGRAG